MSKPGLGLVCRGALVAALAMVAAACAPTTAPPQAPPAAGQGLAAARPEKTDLRIGLSVHGPGQLPVYVAGARTFREEGLNVEVLSFNGDGGVVQALASDSVDLIVPSLNGLINMISAGQPVRGFYAGFHQADFEWRAKPEVRGWADMKGRRVAIASYGGLTDFLTRHALRKHGLEPERDVQLVQSGGSANALQALRAGTADAAILVAPFKWQAEAEGFGRLGAQATDVAAEWPRNILVAKETLLDDGPNTLRAVLRAHVRAIRLAKADREAAVQIMMDVLKYERQHAERAYDEVIVGFDERGRLPAAAMPVFWEIATAAGEVSEPWPEARFLDRRFVDTFEAWAPR